MLIFLIGMMGSGKTTLGRRLAQELGYTFIDLDAFIEQREKRSIASVFAEHGENAFREMERAALEAVVQEYKSAVIATGGGAPCFLDNISYMNQHGDTLFLSVPPEELSRRLLSADLSTRPLLAGKTADEIISFITKTLAHRVWFYQQAKYKVEGSDITVAQLRQRLNPY